MKQFGHHFLSQPGSIIFEENLKLCLPVFGLIHEDRETFFLLNHALTPSLIAEEDVLHGLNNLTNIAISAVSVIRIFHVVKLVNLKVPISYAKTLILT